MPNREVSTRVSELMDMCYPHFKIAALNVGNYLQIQIGNIYTAGYQMANTTSFSPVFMLAKYNYEGQLDTTFGNGGFVSAQPESGYNFCYTALCSGMEKLCSEEMHRIPRAGMTLQ